MLHAEITDKIVSAFYKVYFGKSAEFKRVIFTNDRKDITKIETTNP